LSQVSSNQIEPHVVLFFHHASACQIFISNKHGVATVAITIMMMMDRKFNLLMRNFSDDAATHKAHTFAAAWLRIQFSN
jgi:hypothetical protein